MVLGYRVVDVFTQTALEGNALAVFPDAGELDERTMQRIAREMNLSETTFVRPPQAPGGAQRVRIFTPARELPFAGHPTLGTAYVLRELGRVPRDRARFVLEEGVGPVGVRVDDAADGLLWLTTPPIARGRAYPPDACAAMLGLGPADLLADAPPRVYAAPNASLFVPLVDAAAVDRAALEAAAFARLVADAPDAPDCTFVFAATPAGAYSRMFAPALGIIEDPATGSATGPLALLMMDYGLASRAPGTRLVSEQGAKMGRRSLLHVLVSGEHGRDAIEVGGYVTPVISGSLTISA